MSSIDDIVRTPGDRLGEELLALCRSISAKRARTVIDHILEHGIITNDDLSDLYGYDHPPRAIRDVRENGIPLITHSVISAKTGRRMGAYTFDDPAKIKQGRVGGRTAFPKRFKDALIERYGSRDLITQARLAPRYLQIDHRIPYEVIGDCNSTLDPKDFMLLDASSNRAKSWSCEQCDNFQHKHDPQICQTCFWASPEEYSHIAETPSRRIDLIWTAEEVQQFDRVKKLADLDGMTLPEFIKKKLGE